MAREGRAVFNVFNYITLRAVLACLTALAVSLILGPYVIRKLTAYKIGQAVREEGPRSHLTKAGTPTMGGALILVSMCLTTLLWGDLSNRLVWVVLPRDRGVRHDRLDRRLPQGRAPQSARLAGALEILLAGRDRPLGGDLPRHADAGDAGAEPADRAVLQAHRLSARHDRLHRALTFFVIVGTSNAVNLTDGLDGLAIMPTVMVGSALGIFAYVAGHAVFSKYLGLPYIAGAGELAVICGAIAGAGLGFLVQRLPGGSLHGRRRRARARRRARHHRRHRAPGDRALHHGRRVRRRDALGDAPGAVLPRTGGKRIFRMAPLHHHYELEGWKESQVVVRFWIITMMLVLFGLSTLKLR